MAKRAPTTPEELVGISDAAPTPGDRARENGYAGPAGSHAAGRRDAGGVNVANDTLVGRRRDKGGRIVSVRLPVPVKRRLRASLKGLSIGEAMALLRTNDIDCGDLLKVWEVYKAKALGGDKDACKDYLDRVGGKAAQTIAVDKKVTHTIDEDAARLIESIKLAFGMPAKAPAILPAPRELVETTARVMQEPA